MRGPTPPRRVTLVSSLSSSTPARPWGGGSRARMRREQTIWSVEPIRGRGAPSAAGLQERPAKRPPDEAALGLRTVAAATPSDRCVRAREEAVALSGGGRARRRQQLQFLPQQQITAAARGSCPQNTDAHLSSRDFGRGPVKCGRGEEEAGAVPERQRSDFFGPRSLSKRRKRVEGGW